MEFQEYIKSDESKRRFWESVVWWVVIWSWVAIERLVHQWTDIETVLSAGWIQGISTFLMALGSISFYDWIVENFPWELSEDIKKVIVWVSLAALSGTVNYVWQLKTQWSLEESVIMSCIAWIWLVGYETKLIPKIKSEIINNRYNAIKILLDISNTLWLK